MNQTDLLLRELAVTSGMVKRWAVDVGLLHTMPRGRVAEALVLQYADTHGLTDRILTDPTDPSDEETP